MQIKLFFCAIIYRTYGIATSTSSATSNVVKKKQKMNATNNKSATTACGVYYRSTRKTAEKTAETGPRLKELIADYHMVPSAEEILVCRTRIGRTKIILKFEKQRHVVSNDVLDQGICIDRAVPSPSLQSRRTRSPTPAVDSKITSSLLPNTSGGVKAKFVICLFKFISIYDWSPYIYAFACIFATK